MLVAVRAARLLGEKTLQTRRGVSRNTRVIAFMTNAVFAAELQKRAPHDIFADLIANQHACLNILLNIMTIL